MYLEKSTNDRLYTTIADTGLAWRPSLRAIGLPFAAAVAGLAAALFALVSMSWLPAATAPRFLAALIGVSGWLYVALALQSRSSREAVTCLLFASLSFATALTGSSSTGLALGFLLHAVFGVYRLKIRDESSSRHAALAWMLFHASLAVATFAG